MPDVADQNRACVVEICQAATLVDAPRNAQGLMAMTICLQTPTQACLKGEKSHGPGLHRCGKLKLIGVHMGVF